jgi:uncharacterized protein (TIGR03083 family)
MTAAAINALEREIELASDIIASLQPAEWDLPTDCAGWRVHDLVAHMAATFKTLAGGTVARAEATPDDAERNADAAVAERRGWSHVEVAAEYAEWSVSGLGALRAMNDEAMAAVVIPLGNLGSHPMHLLANAIVFDHYCHLRHDLIQPEGPLTRNALPQDDLRLHAIEDWMLGGLPQMCAEELAVVDRPLNLVFTGPGAASFVLRPGSPYISIEPGTEPGATTVTSGAHEFVSWGTKRRNWRSMGVTVDGNEAYAATVLDAINVI